MALIGSADGNGRWQTVRVRIVSALMAVVWIVGAAFAGTPARAQGELSVSAKACILIEMQTGRVLYEKNADEQLPMASTTKILTALLTLESGELDAYMVVDPGAILVEGTSMGLQAGDQVSKRGLCYGMLLASGNDAANMGAVAVAGSVPAFVEKMNARAAQIGMTHSSFQTPSGLDGDAHYSTARDMALLARTALHNPDFRDICSQKNAKVEYGNPPYPRWLQNHNRLLREYEGTFGVKTGFTKKAGRCLVSAVERNGVSLICVTLSAPDDWNDHRTLYGYGFEQLKSTPLDCNFTDVRIPVVGSDGGTAGVVAVQVPAAALAEGEEAKLQRTVHVPRFLYAPVKAGDIVGRIDYTLDGAVVASERLAADREVALNFDPDAVKPGFWENLWHKIKNFFTGGGN